MGRHDAPITVKCGMKEHTIDSGLHAKFSPDRFHTHNRECELNMLCIAYNTLCIWECRLNISVYTAHSTPIQKL